MTLDFDDALRYDSLLNGVGKKPTFFTCALKNLATSPEVAVIKVKLAPQVQEIIERVAAREGLELVYAELVGGRGNAILRIYIDKPGGVDHHDCAQVSEQVGLILDVEDLIPYQYLLEVASPGLNRGLYKPSDYERFAGLPAHIKLSAPIEGQRNFHGTLVGLDREGGLTVLFDDEKGQRHRFPLDLISKANVEIEP